MAMGDAARQQAGVTHAEPQGPGPGARGTATVAHRLREHAAL